MKITSEPAHYPSIGRCIYCEATGTSLGDEHIVALGLGGNWIIKDASCKKCEIATGKVEHECLRGMLGPVRINMGFKSRHKNRPSHMRAVSVNDKGALESRMIPSEKIPMAAFMFRFEPPGIITGRPRNPGFYARQWHLNDKEKLDKLLIEEGVDNLAVSKMNPHIFARMLAKIAHSFAVAEIGLDNFTPFLQKMIIEGIETPSYYVGGDFTVPPAERDGAMHWVRLQPDDNYLVATIRLFAPLGAPLYHIIVGTLRDGGMNKFPLKE